MEASDKDCPGYLAHLNEPLQDGMNLVISNWGSTNKDMQWLDGDTNCKGDCDQNPTVFIKNLEITTGPPKTPRPSLL